MLALERKLKREAQRATTESEQLSLDRRLRVKAASFRMINDLFYRSSSQTSLQQFAKKNSVWDFASVYHEGYRSQMKKWPERPVDNVIGWLQELLLLEEEGKPLTVLDMGAGDCELWRRCSGAKCKVISVDFAPPKDVELPPVRASSQAYLEEGGFLEKPMSDLSPWISADSISVVVFCLSLMGTDWPAFLREGYRVVESGGWIVIAEVHSRNSDERRFLKVLERLGFVVEHKVTCETYFDTWFFKVDKLQSSKRVDELFHSVKSALLRPCTYKKGNTAKITAKRDLKHDPKRDLKRDPKILTRKKRLVHQPLLLDHKLKRQCVPKKKILINS